MVSKAKVAAEVYIQAEILIITGSSLIVHVQSGESESTCPGPGAFFYYSLSYPITAVRSGSTAVFSFRIPEFLAGWHYIWGILGHG